jgi:hypothetical protein
MFLDSPGPILYIKGCRFQTVEEEKDCGSTYGHRKQPVGMATGRDV